MHAISRGQQVFWNPAAPHEGVFGLSSFHAPGAAWLGQKPQPPPGVNCQATQDGGVVCSDGKVFPPG